MQLKYRGISYNLTFTPINMTDTGSQATYREATYSLQQPQSLPECPHRQLTYRGISYTEGY